MESNQNMLTEKLGVFGVQNGMEKNQIMLMEKLGVIGILKQAIKIPYKCPKFIFLTFLTSLPLIFAMVLHEIILSSSVLETKSLLTPPPSPPPDEFFSGYYSGDFYISSSSSYNNEIETVVMLLQNMSPRLFQLGFLYLVPLHLLDLLNTIISVNSASTIYAERPFGLVEMLCLPFKHTGFTGPLITSLYVLFLNSFILFGLVWAVTNSIWGYFRILYVAGSVILTWKWIEWSALWNMSIVFSVLEETRGLNAFWISGYFSRGNTTRGLQLMLLFFVWRIVLRLLCLSLGGQDKWLVLVATSLLSCAGNVMKWVVCVVYFYDCKKRVLEKKVDVEESEKAIKTNLGSTKCNEV